MRKLTNIEFLEKLHSIKGNDYTPLEEYKGARIHIKFRCNKCGDVFESTPDNIYNGGCIKCGYEAMKKAQRKTNEYFLKEVFELVGNEYTFIDRYINNVSKLRVKHNTCEHEYYVSPRDFLRGSRCPKCKNKRISEGVNLTHDEYMNRLSKVIDNDYEVLSKYKNARTKIKVRHNKCGNEYEIYPSKLLSGNRCRYCVFKEMGEKKAKKHDVFIKEVYELFGDEFDVIGKYKNNSTKIDIKHNKCGYVYKVSPDALLRGNGCPRCRESKGEKTITKILKQNNINFEPQYKFNDCKYKDRLVFDFALINNNKVVGLIEYQGIQHYKPISIFGGEEAFKIQCEKDYIKRKYAKDNNIPLIEVPYYEKNVNDFLINEISKSIPR